MKEKIVNSPHENGEYLVNSEIPRASGRASRLTTNSLSRLFVVIAKNIPDGDRAQALAASEAS